MAVVRPLERAISLFVVSEVCSSMATCRTGKLAALALDRAESIRDRNARSDTLKRSVLFLPRAEHISTSNILSTIIFT